MITDGTVIGRPLVAYVDTQAAITNIETPTIGMFAYASDTHLFGTFNGTSWDWGGGMSASLTSTYVGYGSVANVLTGSPNLTWDGTSLCITNTSGWWMLMVGAYSRMIISSADTPPSPRVHILCDDATGMNTGPVEWQVTTFGINSTTSTAMLNVGGDIGSSDKIIAGQGIDAKIALDSNSATGNFTLSLSPANLTDDRRHTLPNYNMTWPAADASGYLKSDGAGALSWAAAVGGDISGTGVVGQVAEFVTDTKTLQAAKLIGPAANILTITNAAASTLALAVTASKTLTLTAVDNWNLTIPKTGTVVTGTGTATRIAEWVTDANTLQASTLIKTGTNTLTLATGAAAATTWTIPINAAGYLYNDNAGNLSWAAGTQPALTATCIGFGDGANLLTGSSALIWWNNQGIQITHGIEPAIRYYIDGTHYAFVGYNTTGLHLAPISGVTRFLSNAADLSVYFGITVAPTTGIITLAAAGTTPGITITPAVTFTSNVLMGTTTDHTYPRLVVSKGVSGGYPAWAAPDVALFENVAGANTTIQLLSSNAAVCNISFSDSDARNRGIISYSHSTDALTFTTAATLGMSLSSAQALTVVGAFGCNAKAAQTAYASGTLTAYTTGATGYLNATIASELHAAVVAIRAALVANGIMS